MQSARKYNDVLLSKQLNFTNEIDDIKEGYDPYKYVHLNDGEIQVALNKEQEHKEADFRRWLIKNKPASAVMTPIETSTATGVPDVFTCYNGFASWLECKVTITGSGSFRGTQYVYLKKLLEAGGHAKVVVQCLNKNTYKPSNIKVYDAADILSIPIGLFTKQGQNLVFPKSLEPYYIWYYTKKSDKIEDLYEKLLLDTESFTW